MNKFIDLLKGKCECTQIGLLILRVLPGYFLIVNHGWKKITNPEKWNGLGEAVTKYLIGIDFLNPIFGFLAAFAESVGAILVLGGLFTKPAAILVCGTMFFAALYHITGTGNPELALIYFSIFATISAAGPGKYSLDSKFFSNNKN